MSKTAKILVVDDDENVRALLQEALKQDDYQVVTVDSGETALRLIEAQDFDLALIDLRLGGMSGLDVLSELRKRRPDTVVIMLTGHASIESAVEALRKGAHDYLLKPFRQKELRESIRTGLQKRYRTIQRRALLSQLEKALIPGSDDEVPTIELDAELVKSSGAGDIQGEPGRLLRRGDLIVDLLRHEATVDGYLLDLSPTEFKLLSYLANNAPRVIPPQELVREVMGYESEPWEASDMIRYHIYRIRRKIKKATGRTDIIRTVRGIGYTIK